jgi:RHS repeat-associated protein
VGGSITTTYVFGVYEQEGVIARKYYRFNGKPVAMREGASTVSYLHGDHLGSASAATNSSGVLTSWQRFDPWGKIRASNGSMPTKQNFTGQYLDDTGLLYYNARYYDPNTARFISADTVVPGNASGGMDGIALKPLTVSFSEPGFLSKANQENQFGPWFTLSEKERQQLGSPMGPANPQALNRYAYGLNNPVKNTDPTGHWTIGITVGGLGFFGTGVRGSLTFAFDSQGEVALLHGEGGGGSTGVALSIGPGIVVTSAPTVYDLRGDSVQLGFVGGAGVGVSAEGTVGTDRKGDPVYGGSLSLSGVVAYTPPGFPAVVYGTGERDSIIFSTNSLRRFYHAIGMCFEICDVEDE